MWASRRAQRETLVWAAIGCVGSISAMLTTAAEHRLGSLDPQGTWAVIILAQTVVGLIIAWHYRTSKRPLSRGRAEVRGESTPGAQGSRTMSRGAMRRHGGGFSPTELMVVLGIIAILASLMLSHAAAARARAQEATCMSNLKQLVCAMQLYAADYEGKLLPRPRNRIPGGEAPGAGDEEARDAVEDAASRYLLGGYAPYGASMDIWHCPSQPWPNTIEQGRAFIEHARRTGGAVYAGMGNPYYRTYYYTWLERLGPEEARLFKDEPQSTFQIDFLACDTGLLGTHAYESFWTADGNLGERSTTPCPHGDRSNWHRSRTCIGFLDGHVESLTPGEWDRHRYGHFSRDLWCEAIEP